MSTHPPAHNTDALPDGSQSLEPIYTDFLIRNDEAFATDYAETQLFGCRAPDSVSNMAQGSVVASEQPFSTYNSWDKDLHVDTYSWEECLESIENHDWSVSSSEHERSVSSDGAHCASASLEIAATSQHDFSHQMTPAPDDAHSAKSSVRLAEASGRCDFADTSRDPSASLTASENNIPSDNASISIARLASALHNAPESTPATAEQENTPVETNTAIEYLLTPAMSVTDFQTTGEEAYSKPSPTTDSEPAELSHCDIEPQTATAPVSVRTTSHYRPPSITTHPTSTADESPELSPAAPTVSNLCATDVQLIPRPPQDFYQTYMAEKVVNRALLSGNDLPRAQAAVTPPSKVFETTPAPVLGNAWQDTPPASPGAEVQELENDLTSVMAALASYPVSVPLQTCDLKRPSTDTELVDGIEERANKKKKLADTRTLADAEGHLTGLNSWSVQSTAIDANPNTTISATLAVSKHTDSQNKPADPLPQRFHTDQINAATLPRHFGGAYTQPPNQETEERLTTALESPTVESSSPASASTACTRVAPGITTSEDTTQTRVLAEHSSTAKAERNTESDTDELSEVADEEISLLASEVFSPGEDHGLTLPVPANTADAERPTKRRKVDKMDGKSDGDVVGVRTTRGAARLAEERRRVEEREGCIKRRLRLRGGV